jgi:hypothetical protein
MDRSRIQVFVKPRLANVSLAAASVLFLSGFFILCECPGWFAVAAGFAGLAALTSKGKLRMCAIGLLICSLAATGIETYILLNR